MANITSEQLVQYDTKIKQYIQTQITSAISGYKQTIAVLNSTIETQTNKINELESEILNLKNSGAVISTTEEPVEELIDTNPTLLKSALSTNLLKTNSLGNLGNISIMSISPDPETIVVQEDIQEDYIIYDRTISPNENKEYKNIVVTTDNKSNRIFFSMWYTFDNRELENKEICVVWINADGNKGESICVDKQLIGNRLYFAWNIPGSATYRAGIIRYAIRITSDEYAWHTLPAEIECVQGLVDDGWDNIDDAENTPGWLDYIEGKYNAGLQVVSESEYNNLEEKSENIIYIVKMEDGTVTQYLGTLQISNSGSGSGGTLANIVQLTTAEYDALGENIQPDTLYLLTD